ncbi:hypothetical protein GCM10010313_33900 [Streptomyces violarus]|uniref:Tetratricopeptide (TPR) repeat protein n=1 Tax=Streptomyces violarus TaxID=67380 RepID=A0A7W4ZP60_9ACTN|nr:MULTISPECIES: ATP-binding protein [Streptomyces]MBB3076107.1 tetratricopeptide (TPR) repeat protein [Streptomyces violarus]WRT98938.1 ATP-binding protein [Streptomyces sp. CGMCC 4.1772]GHD11128.1 hypothetical protein GCM10010313_33900 [Streptomyces violarus]
MGQDLRGPAPPPEFGGFFGRSDELERIGTWSGLRTVTTPSSGRGLPSLMVLHGPAGVGKSALVAEACRQYDLVPHWISLYDAARADVEPALLRLLGESGGSRAAIVRAALGDDRAFRRTLRGELAQVLSGRLLVLDGVTPPVGRALLSFLRDCRGLVVLATSRQEAGWRRTGARLLAVDPLNVAKTRDLVARMANGEPWPDHDTWYGRTSWPASLVEAVQGLPALARVASLFLGDRTAPRSEPRDDESGPQWLVRLALTGCTPDQRGLLSRLAERNSGAPFTLRTVELLHSLDGDLIDVRSALGGLLAKELVQRWSGAETFCLPQPVADAVRTAERPSPVPSAKAVTGPWAARVLQGTAAVLDGRTPQEHHAGPGPERLGPWELVPHLDEFLSLLTDFAHRGRQQDAIADGLALLLAVRGDAHRLVALHRLWPILSVRRALSSLAADLGLPEQAKALYDTDKWLNPDAVHHGAALCHQSGQLADALSMLDVLLGDDARPDDRHTAWALLVLGAVRCDQGEVAEAERALLRAAALHRASKCRRGLGWTLLHSARVCLLSGRVTEAGRLLDEADEILLSVADTRGRNWVTTERLRLALRHGAPVTAAELAGQAQAQHAAAEDVRGLAWTSLYLAPAHLEQDDLRHARVALETAEEYFLKCGDDLGSAWTKHRIALLASAPEGDHSGAVLVSLAPAWALFQEIGCPLGTAWTELEMVARRRPTDVNLPLLALAEEHFRALGDAYGMAWAATIRAVHRNHLRGDGPRSAGALISSLPHDIPIPDPERLVREITLFWEVGGVLGGRTIPFHARDTVAVRHTGPWFLDVPGQTGPRCRVRVTLLDDTPAEDTTARLLLRVSPEDGHPWGASGAARPWLTVTAAPLTHASVDPASALLLPSEQAAHGAEFAFTAHRTGTHRIRFTIALERTGTVLQQVETELDILDHDEHGGLSSPEAVTHRGR